MVLVGVVVTVGLSVAVAIAMAMLAMWAAPEALARRKAASPQPLPHPLGL